MKNSPKKDSTPIQRLFDGANKGHLNKITNAIGERADVNAHDEARNTPLHYATQTMRLK